jgi:hypothetical protein
LSRTNISHHFRLKRKFTAGEAFNESMDDVHRDYTTDEPAEVIITYAGVEGQALSEPYTS